VTNSPRHPKRPHRRGREPATIDLKATVIPDPVPESKAQSKPEPESIAGTGPSPATAAAPEATPTPAEDTAPHAPETRAPEADRKPAGAAKTVTVPGVARSADARVEAEPVPESATVPVADSDMKPEQEATPSPVEAAAAGEATPAEISSAQKASDEQFVGDEAALSRSQMTEERPAAAEEAATAGAEAAATSLASGTADAAGEPADREQAVEAAPPPARRGPGIGSLLAASLLGGAVGGGLVLAYQAAQPVHPDPRIAILEQRIASLPRTTAPAAPAAPAGLDQRLAQIEGNVSGLTQRLDETHGAAERALARAEEAMARPAPAPAGTPQPDTAALDEVRTRLETVERSAGERAEQLTKAQASLQEAVQNVTQAQASLQQSMQAMEGRVAELGQSLDRRLNEQIGALGGRISEQGQAAERRIAEQTQALEGRLAAQGQGFEGRLAEQQTKLSEVSAQVARIAEGSEIARAGTRVVLADRLAVALDEGVPLGNVVGALPGYGVAPERLTAFEPYTETGAPTAEALTRDFESVREPILRESRPRDGDLWERVARMADKVVTVRAVDEPGSATPPAIVNRIEHALGRGAFGEALAAYEALPEPARQASEEFGTALRRRAAAEAASRDVTAEAVQALRAPTRTP
jgi:hypothetical protein